LHFYEPYRFLILILFWISNVLHEAFHERNSPLSIGHFTDGLGLPDGFQKPAEVRARAETESVHQVMSVNKPGRFRRAFFFKIHLQHVTGQPGVRPPLLPVEVGAAGGQVVGQGQEKQVDACGAGITEVTVNGPAGGGALVAHLRGTEVVLDEERHVLYFAVAEPQSGQNRSGGVGPQPGVSQKAGTAALIRGLGLRFGDVVEQRRYLEQYAPRAAATYLLPEVFFQRRRPGYRSQLRGSGKVPVPFPENELRGGDRLKRMVKNVPDVQPGLDDAPGRSQLGYQGGEQPQSVQVSQPPGGAG
jgi:hypothetical protein